MFQSGLDRKDEIFVSTKTMIDVAVPSKQCYKYPNHHKH